MKEPNAIFVFGSNVLGLHGGGAARAAHEKYGATWGLREGPMGRSYAIPTVGQIGHSLPITAIRSHVWRFVQYAIEYPEKTFVLTRIGCGLAGYADSEIAPLFAKAPANVIKPTEWENL